MTLIERIETSEVFAELTKADRKAILQAIEAGNDEVTEEAQAILDKEDAIKKLYDRSIKELTEHTVQVMHKRLEGTRKLRKIAGQEIIERAKASGMAEIDLEAADLPSKK